MGRSAQTAGGYRRQRPGAWSRRFGNLLLTAGLLLPAVVFLDAAQAGWERRAALAAVHGPMNDPMPRSRDRQRSLVAVDLVIPKIKLRVLVWEGDDPDNLRLGPVRLAGSAGPGEPGRMVVAGHRNTHGSPFRRLGDLEPGDDLYFDDGLTRHHYRVTGRTVVAPNRLDPHLDERRPGLTLLTCHPYLRGTERLLVFAEYVDEVDTVPDVRAR